MPLRDRQYLQVNQAVFSVANAYASRMTKEEGAQPVKLGIADRSVLMVLGQFAPINSRRLAQLMDLHPGTISIHVQRLLEKGLVAKTQDEIDRRSWSLELTESGDVAYADTIAGAVTYTRDFLAVLNQSEQRTLHRLLLKVAHELGYEWQ
jgi:DNA-binding MarR family transcriptional regulator